MRWQAARPYPSCHAVHAACHTIHQSPAAAAPKASAKSGTFRAWLAERKLYVMCSWCCVFLPPMLSGVGFSIWPGALRARLAVPRRAARTVVYTRVQQPQQLAFGTNTRTHTHLHTHIHTGKHQTQNGWWCVMAKQDFS